MIVSYTPSFFDDYAEIEYSPRLPVVFTHPKTNHEVTLFGLVDSGAAETILHVRMAPLLGIDDIRSGQKALYGGIGGLVEGYRHTLRVHVAGERKEHEITCAFAPIADMDCLLGQRGFFEHYKIVFEKYKNQFEVVTKRSGQSK
jgi:gag-polyprotein putative aspartyl protease